MRPHTHEPHTAEECTCGYDYDLGECGRCAEAGFVLIAGVEQPCPQCVWPAHVKHLAILNIAPKK